MVSTWSSDGTSLIRFVESCFAINIRSMIVEVRRESRYMRENDNACFEQCCVQTRKENEYKSYKLTNLKSLRSNSWVINGEHPAKQAMQINWRFFLFCSAFRSYIICSCFFSLPPRFY